MDNVKCICVRSDGYAYFEVGNKTILTDPTGATVDGDITIPRAVLKEAAREFIHKEYENAQEYISSLEKTDDVWCNPFMLLLREQNVTLEQFYAIVGSRPTEFVRMVEGASNYQGIVMKSYRVGSTTILAALDSYGRMYWWRTYGTR